MSFRTIIRFNTTQIAIFALIPEMVMYLSHLKIENFKNYEAVELTLQQGLVCFTGPNGAGKTNLLDAIYDLCTGKSYFNSIDQQLIRDGADYFSIKGEFEKNNVNESVLCVVMKGRKKVIKRNDDAYTRLIDHYGVFPVVMVAPGDMELIIGGSEERRKWIDSAISLLNKDYLVALLKYDKLLQQRNAELRKMALEPQNQSLELIKIYDSMIIPVAEEIYNVRNRFSKDFMPFFEDYYQQISEKKEKVSFSYQSEMHIDTIPQLLEKSIKKDMILQRTNVGPHRDDLEFLIGERPLKKFGSQGQQKTFLLALKLAERQFITSVSGQIPILLLDDVCERLDGHRLHVLFRLIQEREPTGQVFLSDTSAERVTSYLETNTVVQMYHVNKGNLTEGK